MSSKTHVIGLDGKAVATLRGSFYLPAGAEVALPDREPLMVTSSRLVVHGRVNGTHSAHVEVTVDFRTPAPVYGSWFLYTHAMGGDSIAIETTDATLAEDFICARYDVESSDELFDDDLGYIWSLHEGEGPDGSQTTRPISLDDELGRRGDGSSRTTYVSEAEARAVVAGK